MEDDMIRMLVRVLVLSAITGLFVKRKQLMRNPSRESTSR